MTAYPKHLALMQLTGTAFIIVSPGTEYDEFGHTSKSVGQDLNP
jgi:hypothetical protein